MQHWAARWLISAALALCFAAPTVAQIVPQVLFVDPERVYQDSRTGQAIESRIQQERDVLVEETSRLSVELEDEERELAELRATMTAAEFAELATAFDEKVRRIRAEQDQKAEAFTESVNARRQAFQDGLQGLYSEALRQTGALVILDSRQVVVADRRLDLTTFLIRLVDQAAEAAAQDAQNQADEAQPAPDMGDATQ